MKRVEKRVSIFICVMLIVGMLCAIIFVNEECHHKCSGHGCAICLQIHNAEQLIHSVKGSSNGICQGLLIICFLLGVLNSVGLFLQQKTLITMKVELLD